MSMKRTEPPRFMLRFLKWFWNPEYHADIEGDLLEFYDRRVTEIGRTQANLQLFKDVLSLLRPGIIRSATIPQHIIINNMIKSYFIMGWRNLRKSKLHSSLNVLGLTFGMVCFLFIGLYVYDELTFDDQHLQADRIYRVITNEKNPNNEATTVAASSYMLAEESRYAIPEIQKITRMSRLGGANLFDPENPVNVQEKVTIADEYFLQVFDFPLIEGDKRTALKEPNSIVITEALAMRIFNTADVINKNLQFSHFDIETPLKITGILKNHPHNSTFNFTSLMSESTMQAAEWFRGEIENDWSSTTFSAYALLRPQSNPDSVSGKLEQLVRDHAS